jgi:adenosylcobyric acid synthase
MPMGALMVQGTSSWAGKSLVTTALARALARGGIDVVPFKAQNMSNNARVVEGGEIGTAQYLQALAAGVDPDVRMNPVLIKPMGNTESQVVVLGKVDRHTSGLAWRARPAHLRAAIESALSELLAEHELILIEGAGSPAEINLRDADLANMHIARLAGAPVLLVADIDRGGAFAHLYGTWALLPAQERRLIAGFLLNKFRGERSLLAPAPERLAQLTGVPTLGVLPWLDHALPDEDGASATTTGATTTGARDASAATPTERAGSVVVVRYPTASNLDELKALEQVVQLRWASAPAEIEGADLVILPGSKHVASDLAWLKESGIASGLRRRVAQGGAVLGICGGMQMLGESICDRGGVDGSAQGLGLLPIRTSFAAGKRTEVSTVRFCEQLPEPWGALGGKEARGYQIRHGSSRATAPLIDALPEGLGFLSGPVLGVYLHGLLEQPEILGALFGRVPPRTLEATFDALADAIEAHLDVGALVEKALGDRRGWPSATRRTSAYARVDSG